MDFESWIKNVESNERKLRLYNLHKKYFILSRFSTVIDMVIVIVVAVLAAKSLGLFSSQTHGFKSLLMLVVSMVLTYFIFISIPLFLFSRTIGLLITGLKAVSSKTLSAPSLTETFYYIGQDKRYQKNYPIYIFLVPANIKI
ncbi:MAG: RDD family protein [bacterium]|nr:RDD family protein [bacterium]